MKLKNGIFENGIFEMKEWHVFHFVISDQCFMRQNGIFFHFSAVSPVLCTGEITKWHIFILCEMKEWHIFLFLWFQISRSRQGSDPFFFQNSWFPGPFFPIFLVFLVPNFSFSWFSWFLRGAQAAEGRRAASESSCGAGVGAQRPPTRGPGGGSRSDFLNEIIGV